jgi:membrane protease subunit (stomatin/prohibitin family)
MEHSLDEHGRCPVCNASGLMPGLQPEQEYIQSEQMKRDNLKELIREVLVEIEAEKAADKEEASKKTKECVKCGVEFTPRAPAQKICDACSDKKSK